MSPTEDINWYEYLQNHVILLDYILIMCTRRNCKQETPKIFCQVKNFLSARLKGGPTISMSDLNLQKFNFVNFLLSNFWCNHCVLTLNVIRIFINLFTHFFIQGLPLFIKNSMCLKMLHKYDQL